MRGGNATLDPMTGTVAEVGWRSTRRGSDGMRWTGTASAYYARISDEILSLDDPNAPGNSLVTNIDKTTHAGLEALVGAASRSAAAASHRAAGQLHAQPIPLRRRSGVRRETPARGAHLRRARRGALPACRRLLCRPHLRLHRRAFADFANTYAVDSYGLVGLRAGFTSAAGKCSPRPRILRTRTTSRRSAC